MAKQNGNGEKVKSMEAWIWDAACSIRGAADAPKFKDYILPQKNSSSPTNRQQIYLEMEKTKVLKVH